MNRNVTEVLLYVFHRDEEKIGEDLWKQTLKEEKKQQRLVQNMNNCIVLFSYLSGGAVNCGDYVF